MATPETSPPKESEEPEKESDKTDGENEKASDTWQAKEHPRIDTRMLADVPDRSNTGLDGTAEEEFK